MRLLIRDVNHDSFPHYPTARNLPELLSSVGTQPVRCAAVWPGHLAIAVANGTYLHVLSARGAPPCGGGDSGHSGAPDGEATLGRSGTRDGSSSSSSECAEETEIENLRRAFGRSLPVHGHGMEEEDSGDSHLSFHGASPVAALAFVPKDFTTGRPLCLLAVQEDGAVAAWRRGAGRLVAISLKAADARNV
jgi:hypothetical protein